MLTYAINFVQAVQVVCLAVLFICMAWRDRDNKNLRWLGYAYVVALVGGLLDVFRHSLPNWLGVALGNAADPLAYGCVQIAVVHFVGRGRATRWIPVAILLVSLPLYLRWDSYSDMVQRVTVQDLALCVQTLVIAVLLWGGEEDETKLPRRLMSAFLFVYSGVEAARFVMEVQHHTLPETVWAPMNELTGLIYVVAGSILPLAFIWMMNARLHTHLQRQSLCDPLTNLLNRRGLQDVCEQELAQRERIGNELAVVVADIDHFKDLNDTYGHVGGDEVLCDMADMLRDTLRHSDTIGRLGGEEFVILLSPTEPKGAMELVERLRATLERHAFRAGDQHTKVTASFGVTMTNGRRGLTWEQLLNEADAALYKAKRAGRNRVEIADLVLVSN